MGKPSSKSDKISFPNKLFNVVNNSEYISWTDDGESFYISDIHQFESKVMKLHFNNCSIESFFRQLYGFKRIVDGRRTRYQMPTNYAYFQYTSFKKGQSDLLAYIHREKRKKNAQSETPPVSEDKFFINQYIPYGTKAFKKNISQVKDKVTTVTKNYSADQKPEILIESKSVPMVSIEPETQSIASVSPLDIVDSRIVPLDINPLLFQNSSIYTELPFNSSNIQQPTSSNNPQSGNIQAQSQDFESQYNTSQFVDSIFFLFQ